MSKFERVEVFDSVFSQVDAIVYRCANDDDYTMEFLVGQVAMLTGYPATDILGNSVVSWVGITHEDDIDRVVAEVDAAIEAGRSWDVDYRINRADGRVSYVRERGNAVFENGELAYLQGLVVSAMAEVDLREEAERSAQSATTEAKRVAEIAENILQSVNMLQILSVNASIEASRSGDAGRGFAVVAEEMARLADENGRLAAEIKSEISKAESQPKL